MSRRGVVSLDGARVGVIEERGTGTRFIYDRAWLDDPDAVPISLAMPLREEPYEQEVGLLPFFANLLPEGWLLEISTEKLKISRDDGFGLLLATCADCIGAVEVRPEEREERA